MADQQVAIYNDSDRFVAAWLRQLIAAGQITAGAVLDQPIANLQPADVTGFNRVHLFAGIGGWDLALAKIFVRAVLDLFHPDPDLNND